MPFDDELMYRDRMAAMLASGLGGWGRGYVPPGLRGRRGVAIPPGLAPRWGDVPIGDDRLASPPGVPDYSTLFGVPTGGLTGGMAPTISGAAPVVMPRTTLSAPSLGAGLVAGPTGRNRRLI